MPAHHDPDVSIVLPCLNEAGTLPGCIDNARLALVAIAEEFGLCGEIVVADNGSTDGSREIATRRGVRIIPVAQRGYGCALRAGCTAAFGRFIVIGDSDGSYDFREAVPMVGELLAGKELCMGSRFKGCIMPGAMPWKNRHIGNPALTGLLNVLFRSGMTDAHSGLRAFTADAFARMRLSATGMEFASEVVIKASLLRLRRSEVPITLHPDRRDREPHLRPWRDGWRHLRYLLMLSPGFLFLGPAAVLGGISAALLILLVLAHDSTMLHIGPLAFGDHWAILSGAALIACAQFAVFGLATTLYGVREGYRTPDPWLVRLFGYMRLENMILGGLALIALGGGLLLHVVGVWTASDFGALALVRETVAGSVVLLLGLQALFGGFFLAIINGNEPELGGEATMRGTTHAVRPVPATVQQRKTLQLG